MSLRWFPDAARIPRSPGVYEFSDAAELTIYVGKAIDLRSRLLSYAREDQTRHPRTDAMLHQAVDVRWTVCRSDAEALLLEATLIREQRPRFNVKLVESDTYSGVSVDTARDVPRIHAWRGARPATGHTFGPYPNTSVREIIDVVTAAFGVRSCTDNVYRTAQRRGHPCLLADIGRCLAPCVDRVAPDEHRAAAVSATAFLAGTDRRILDTWEQEMHDFAATERFEAAARRRDQLDALRAIVARQGIHLAGPVDLDVFAFADTGDVAGFTEVVVRAGATRMVHTVLVERDHLVSAEDQLAVLVTTACLQRDDVTRVVLDRPPAAALVTLGTAHGWSVGPAGTDDERRVLELARLNAADAPATRTVNRWDRIDDINAALTALGAALGMTSLPSRIDCFDISHLQGRQAIASVVVFVDGHARNEEYRRIPIPATLAGDDPASIAHAVRERLRTAPFADLLLIDGGPTQVAAASSALEEVMTGVVGVRPAVAGLAKRFEELWLPAASEPVVLRRDDPGLFLAQAARDEAHRWAREGHRRARERAALRGALDDIPGLGPKRRKALLDAFGSPVAVLAASEEELAAVPGIGPAMAATIAAAVERP